MADQSAITAAWIQGWFTLAAAAVGAAAAVYVAKKSKHAQEPTLPTKLAEPNDSPAPQSWMPIGQVTLRSVLKAQWKVIGAVSIFTVASGILLYVGSFDKSPVTRGYIISTAVTVAEILFNVLMIIASVVIEWTTQMNDIQKHLDERRFKVDQLRDENMTKVLEHVGRLTAIVESRPEERAVPDVAPVMLETKGAKRGRKVIE